VKERKESLQEQCPKCGKSLIWKTGNHGAFLSCIDFPHCFGKLDILADKNPTTKLLTKGKRPTDAELKEYHRIKKVVWKVLGVNKPSNVEMSVLLTRKLGKSINTISDVKRAAIEYYGVIHG